MKKRINELLNGNITYEPVKPVLSHERIEGNVNENEIYRGRFQVTAPAGSSLRGFLYSTNPRIGFKPATFSGNQEQFIFEADTTGLINGDVISGAFILNTSLGEYHIPYDITVRGHAAEQKTFNLSLQEFTDLTRRDFGEGYMLFRSLEFQKNLSNWDSHCMNLYRGLRESENTYLCLEQFLVGTGMKEPVRLSLENEKLLLYNVNEVIREEITLRRDNWGFAKLDISCDSDILTIEHPVITTDEFVGNSYHISVLIHKEKLHCGHNYARIHIRYGYEELIAEVEVFNETCGISEKNLRRQHQEIIRLISSYLSYRTGRISKDDWASISLDGIYHYHQAGGTHIFSKLFELYIHLLKKNTVEIERLQNELSARKEDLKDPTWYGIYLYLASKQNTNSNYQELVEDHIQTLYLENQENWILQILMFYVNGHLIKNDTEKLDLMRRQYQCGCNSPILFLEASGILKKEPLMLRNLGAFEIHLLQFMCREGLLDREICGQIAQLACRMQQFHPVLFKILCKCFHTYPSQKMLTAICTMLINGRVKNEAAAEWYALGIKSDVRITGIYEYFVETMCFRKETILPQSVRMYFIHHNTMDYIKKAQIFSSIILNKKEDPDSYDQYYKSMEQFAEEQMEAGRISTDLAILYNDIVTDNLLTSAMAEGLEKILFTYEVTSPIPALRELIILHEEFENEQRVSIADGIANIQIFSPEAVVLAEDRNGNRYACPKALSIRPLFENPQLEERCKKLLKKPAELLLHECYKDTSVIQINPENVNAYIHVLEIPHLKKKYAQKVRSALITYFSEKNTDQNLPVFLMMEETQDPIIQKMANWISVLAAEGKYEKIYELISINGYERIPLSLLVRMCNFIITEHEYEEDKMLLAICSYCFSKGLYDEVMLRYLMQHYEGPAETMKAIWVAGTDYGLESIELEERILLISLFTQQNLEGTEDIFKSYVFNSGKKVICMAYSILMSYEYFVRVKPVKDFILEYVEENMYNSKSAPDVCRLALMQYYTSLPELSELRTKRLYRLVDHYQEKGMQFGFLKRLPYDIQKKLQIHDKFILEFRHKPCVDVTLHYQYNDGKKEVQIMNEIFEGIYTKEFTVFYGDTFEWYFEYQDNQGKECTEPQKKTFDQDSHKNFSTKYDLINRMLQVKASDKEEMFQKLKEQYLEQQHLVDELFPIN